MLWLAGLMGIMVVGAVTLIDFSDDTSEDEEDVIGFDDFINENGQGDLSQTLQDLNALPPDQPDAQGDPLTYAAIGDWITADNPTDVEEFDTAEDDLVLIWDDEAQADEPNVRLVANIDDPDITDVIMGDMVVAHVPSDAGLTSDNIALIPMSAAQIMGWTETGAVESDTDTTPV